jgi:hypothetical protein
MTLKLNSIDKEAAACREAFKDFPVGGFTLHCHHEQLGEILTEPAENRIVYILSSKPKHEQALRLRLFRPVSKEKLEAYAKYQEADAKYQEAYAKYQEAYAKWREANAKYQEAYAKYQEAYAKRQEAYAKLANLIHGKFCVAGCPWDGKTIFSKG